MRCRPSDSPRSASSRSRPDLLEDLTVVFASAERVWPTAQLIGPRGAGSRRVLHSDANARGGSAPQTQHPGRSGAHRGAKPPARPSAGARCTISTTSRRGRSFCRCGASMAIRRPIPLSGRSGLLGILLPEFPLRNNNYDPDDLPQRLRDNVDSRYADIRRWDQISGNPRLLVDVVETAFSRRTRDDLVKNGRIQTQRNAGPY